VAYYIAGDLVLREKPVLCTVFKMPHTSLYILVRNRFLEYSRSTPLSDHKQNLYAMPWATHANENAIPWIMVGLAFAVFTSDFIAYDPMQNKSPPYIT
jgi:hypothetical protein